MNLVRSFFIKERYRLRSAFVTVNARQVGQVLFAVLRNIIYFTQPQKYSLFTHRQLSSVVLEIVLTPLSNSV